MLRLVSAFMSTTWAGHDVIGVQNTFTFGKVGEEEDRRFAFLARDDDIPPSGFGLKHGAPPSIGSKNLGAGLPHSDGVSVYQLKRLPDLAAACAIYLIRAVCTSANAGRSDVTYRLERAVSVFSLRP